MSLNWAIYFIFRTNDRLDGTGFRAAYSFERKKEITTEMNFVPMPKTDDSNHSEVFYVSYNLQHFN